MKLRVFFTAMALAAVLSNVSSAAGGKLSRAVGLKKDSKPAPSKPIAAPAPKTPAAKPQRPAQPYPEAEKPIVQPIMLPQPTAFLTSLSRITTQQSLTVASFQSVTQAGGGSVQKPAPQQRQPLQGTAPPAASYAALGKVCGVGGGASFTSFNPVPVSSGFGFSSGFASYSLFSSSSVFAGSGFQSFGFQSSFVGGGLPSFGSGPVFGGLLANLFSGGSVFGGGAFSSPFASFSRGQFASAFSTQSFASFGNTPTLIAATPTAKASFGKPGAVFGQPTPISTIASGQSFQTISRAEFASITTTETKLVASVAEAPKASETAKPGTTVPAVFQASDNPIGALLGGRIGSESFKYSLAYTLDGIDYSLDLEGRISASFAGASASPSKASQR